MKTEHLIHLDIDECELNTNDCNKDNGFCNNTVGSYTCACHLGFSGDGVNCTGISYKLHERISSTKHFFWQTLMSVLRSQMDVILMLLVPIPLEVIHVSVVLVMLEMERRVVS